MKLLQILWISQAATSSQLSTLVTVQHASNCDPAWRQQGILPPCHREGRAKVNGGEEKETEEVDEEEWSATAGAGSATTRAAAFNLAESMNGGAWRETLFLAHDTCARTHTRTKTQSKMRQLEHRRAGITLPCCRKTCNNSACWRSPSQTLSCFLIAAVPKKNSNEALYWHAETPLVKKLLTLGDFFFPTLGPLMSRKLNGSPFI